MSNPIDAFREQRAVAADVHATLKEVAVLLASLKHQTDSLIPLDELRQLLEQERTWLRDARHTLNQVRELRANELRILRASRLTQWAIALGFALASAVAMGAGYAWVTKPFATELSELRARQDFTELVERRFVTMTSAERRQFDALMKWSSPTKR